MSNLEATKRPTGEPGIGIHWRKLNPRRSDLSELARIIKDQMAAGREICLITLRDDALQAHPLDLRGTQGRPEEEQRELQETFIEAMTKSVVVLIEDGRG